MRRLMLVLLALALDSSGAKAQSIGIFFDEGAATCSGVIAAGSSGRIYIIAVPGGDASDGITGVEFRVVGLPAGWVPTSVRNPAAVLQFGDPFDGVGVIASFPTCQTAPTILIFTVDLFATTSVSNHYLRIAQRNPPPNPNFRCPLVVGCGPTFTLVCASGGEAIINPTGPGCTVAVTPSSWSRMKGLYD